MDLDEALEQLAGTAAGAALDGVSVAVDALADVDLDSLTPAQQLAAIQVLETHHRRLDRQTDRVAGTVDSSGAYGIDGHRSAKAAVKARCRVTGPEAHARLRNERMLRTMPAVAAAYAGGDIPSESVRSIARTLANPRVADFGPFVDEVFAEQATVLSADEFRGWLRDWVSVADVDGAEQAAEANHQRRNCSLLENSIDSSWSLRGGFGALQGAAMAEIFRRFEDAEFDKDWKAAKAIHGDDTRVEHLARTAAQRRADAMFAVFRRAASLPEGSVDPEPLVNVVVDADTFNEALTGEPAPSPARADSVVPTDLAARRCQTVAGTRLTPSEALSAALHGHVRRVVVDGASNVIDLGRRRRLFTGSARDAALLQAVLRNRERLRCDWIDCEAPSHRIQVDHAVEWTEGGRTDMANARTFCGSHNRLKHHLVRSGQDPGHLWRIRRPD
ncbi:MAG: DUF222 domain-containing protein [Acidimicrobiales bacterium]|nr:DUF222 domain-containing protein [Acidimicrobiales bacterium]